MQKVREGPTSAIVNIAGSDCAAGVFVIRALINRRVSNVAATHRWPPKARCADSESRILAMKKFSCPPASRLIAARQNRFFARIASTDSQDGFRFERPIRDHGERSMHAHMRMNRDDGGDAGVV
jgi:hypothetical protein